MAPVEWTTRDAINSLPITRQAGGRSARDRHRPEPAMTLPRTVAEVLREHVTLEVECIDRLYLNAYVPKLQHELGVVGFLRGHHGHPIASSVLLQPISDAFIQEIERFARQYRIPVVAFTKGQRKDEVAREHLARFDAEEGI